MKIRIKFAKGGALKFVGHLDMMRYFQKLIRRAEIDIAYSEGFNPHQKMSFAQPLGVGVLSQGEYVDLEVNSTYTTSEAIKRLNAANVDGVEILSYRLLDDTSGNAMASVSGADYKIEFRDGYKPHEFNFLLKFQDFFNSSEEIVVTKQTKKSEAEVNIKPYIYKYNGNSDSITIQLASGSAANIKPELVMSAFYNYLGIPLMEYTFIYTRLEVYGYAGDGRLIPLEDFGQEITNVK